MARQTGRMDRDGGKEEQNKKCFRGALIVLEDMDVVHEEERISNLGKRKNRE